MNATSHGWHTAVYPAGTKHAWTHGRASIKRNETRGIVPREGVMFNSLLGISQAVEDIFIAQGITLHVAKKMAKYISQDGLE